METSALAQSETGSYAPVAGPLHTILVLAALAALGVWTLRTTDRLRAAVNPNRVRFYALTILFEWILLVLVVAGVSRFGAPILSVIGDRWQTARGYVLFAPFRMLSCA